MNQQENQQSPTFTPPPAPMPQGLAPPAPMPAMAPPVVAPPPHNADLDKILRRLTGIETAVLQLQQKVFGTDFFSQQRPEPVGEPVAQEVPVPPRKVALVIGHKKSSPGACDGMGMCEFIFNEQIAHAVKRRVETSVVGIDVDVVYRDDSPTGYRDLPARINNLNPDFIISLHLNGYDGPGGEDPQGTETLHADLSTRGHALAGIVQKHLIHQLRRRNRGLRPTSEEGRGGYVLYHTKAPMVIAEPGFIESSEEFGYITANSEKLVAAYADAIIEASRTQEIFL